MSAYLKVDDSWSDQDEEDLVSLLRVSIASRVEPRRLRRMVDDRLTLWGRTHIHEDLREILFATTSKSQMGEMVKRQSGEVYEASFCDEMSYESINSAVCRMNPHYRKFVEYHYVPRPEDKRYRNGRTVTEYCRYLGISRSAYDVQLAEAKDLAAACGVI